MKQRCLYAKDIELLLALANASDWESFDLPEMSQAVIDMLEASNNSEEMRINVMVDHVYI